MKSISMQITKHVKEITQGSPPFSWVGPALPLVESETQEFLDQLLIFIEMYF